MQPFITAQPLVCLRVCLAEVPGSHAPGVKPAGLGRLLSRLALPVITPGLTLAHCNDCSALWTPSCQRCTWWTALSKMLANPMSASSQPVLQR